MLLVLVTHILSDLPYWHNSYLNNPPATVFSESGLSVTPGIPRYISNARHYIKVF